MYRKTKFYFGKNFEHLRGAIDNYSHFETYGGTIKLHTIKSYQIKLHTIEKCYQLNCVLGVDKCICSGYTKSVNLVCL